MAKREPLSKRIRFEVFKRDNFTCQYCGAKAPEATLEVDHIKPVKKGGTNEIMNLITSCFDCNRGKSTKLLSDQSIIEKQRKQIEELNIKRQQLEMMLEWKNELNNIDEQQIESIFKYFTRCSDNIYGLNETVKPEIKIWIKKYSMESIFESIDIAFEKYYAGTKESIENVFNKIGAILHVKSMPEHKQKIAYIKGICKNMFTGYDIKEASIELLSVYERGYDLDSIEKELKSGRFKTFYQFMKYLKED